MGDVKVLKLVLREISELFLCVLWVEIQALSVERLEGPEDRAFLLKLMFALFCRLVGCAAM